MDRALEDLSKSDLISLLKEKEKSVSNLQQRLLKKDQIIAQFQRMLFGQKRERFEGDPAQGALPFEPDARHRQDQQDRYEKAIRYVRKRKSAPNHKGRGPLPDHLPVEELEIHPEGDLSQMVCIGKQVTEELELEPARFYIKRYIRYKYAPKDQNTGGVCIGELPERVIDKGIPGPGLLATILVDKYMDHLPLYRQRQRFAREGIPIASSTLEGWAAQAMDHLQILYDHLLADTKTQGYLQADETPIKVLQTRNKGSTHQGWYWVYHNPINKAILFDYQPTRGHAGARGILEGFKGYLQTDGYGVYDKIGATEHITHLGCWAHARRYFEQALNEDPQRAEAALNYIQKLYSVERTCRGQTLSPARRKELRLEVSLPVLNQMGRWMHGQAGQVLPKSLMGKAISYSAKRWEKLSCYLHDGHLEIDNNLVENAIRPVALGRRNYLFAGSHKAARRAAMAYSFFAMCKAHQVNPHPWLKHTLQNIMSTRYDNIRDLYPQNFKNNM